MNENQTTTRDALIRILSDLYESNTRASEAWMVLTGGECFGEEFAELTGEDYGTATDLVDTLCDVLDALGYAIDTATALFETLESARP